MIGGMREDDVATDAAAKLTASPDRGDMTPTRSVFLPPALPSPLGWLKSTKGEVVTERSFRSDIQCGIAAQYRSKVQDALTLLATGEVRRPNRRSIDRFKVNKSLHRR